MDRPATTVWNPMPTATCPLVSFRMYFNLRLPKENLIYLMNSVCIAKLIPRFGSDCMHTKYCTIRYVRQLV